VAGLNVGSARRVEKKATSAGECGLIDADGTADCCGR